MVDSPWSNVQTLTTAAPPASNSPWSNVEMITTDAPDVLESTGWSNVQSITTAGTITYYIEDDRSLTPCYVFYVAEDGLVPSWPFGTPPPSPVTGRLSGASGTAATDGSFATWRGTEVGIIGDWADDGANTQVNQWNTNPAYAAGSYSKAAWQGAIDLAIGAIFEGETWAQAAAGAYDARWTQALQVAEASWASKPGQMYLRWAHEFNGDWYPWKVLASDAASFVTAWRRFRALQLVHAPSLLLVFSPNKNTTNPGLDWRTCWPGDTYVDVYGVDYYNQYPHVTTDAGWATEIARTHADGSPWGLETHRQWALAHGKPFALPEWNNNGSAPEGGESPLFMQKMGDYLDEHQGGAPGEVLYEVLFNVEEGYPQFKLYPGTTVQPLTAAAYRAELGNPPTQLPTITVTNFQASAPTTTGAVFTFQTDENVPVTRLMEYRVVGTTAWQTHSTTLRTTTHTAGYTRLTASTAYEFRITLYADGFETRVLTAADYPSLKATTASTTAPVPTGNKLSFAPPVLVDPIVWEWTETGTRDLNIPSDRDLRIIMPNRPLQRRGGFQLYGGRNVVLIGGEYRVDEPYYAPENNGGAIVQAAGTNRFFQFQGRAGTAPRTVHLEGLKLHGAELFEVFNFKANRDVRVTVQRQNIWCGKVRARVPNPAGGTHDGGDYWQPIEDPYIDRADREWLSDLEYQGYFLQPTQYGEAGRTLGTWDYRRVQFIGGDTPKQLLAMNGSEPPPERRLLTDVWVQPNRAQGQTDAQAIKGVWNDLNFGTSPVQFVDPTKVGVGYVSPGYV